MNNQANIFENSQSFKTALQNVTISYDKIDYNIFEMIAILESFIF